MTPAPHRAALAAILTTALTTATATAQTVLTSGPEAVPLVELYTSEGCSSCPPADRWFSDLASAPSLWDAFTPVAFHVDYWDDIGWPDRFADAAYSDRQRRYAAESGARIVYTPGMFLAGEEWRGWRHRDAPAARTPVVGGLRVEITGDHVAARFDAADGRLASPTLHVALLGMGLETDVRAGENRGRTLRHDFVALGIESVPLRRDGAAYVANARLPESTVAATRRAVAVWVTQGGRQAPVQSVGGILR